MERTVVFIDGGNFYNGVIGLNIYFYNLDLPKFVQKIVSSSRKLIRAYYYTVRPTDKSKKTYQTQTRFLDQLERSPYFKVRYGRLVQTSGEYREKGADVFLATDMLNLAFNNAYDTAILISGDGDFVEVINSIQNMGKQVENLAFHGRKSDNLLRVCDKFDYITEDILKSCLRPSPEPLPLPFSDAKLSTP